MKPGSAPNFVSALKPFHQSTAAALEEQASGAFSGVSKDGSYCWLVRGAQLEVLEMATRNRLGAWQFGKVLGDQHTNITCVSEFRMAGRAGSGDSGAGRSRKLLVGVCNASSTGLLCLFNVALSKITKAVEIPNPVTEIEVVCTESRSNMPRWALSEQLRYFCGLVTVGTDSGHVYLLDMAMDDDEFYSDEETPSRVHFVCPRNRDVENQRFHCMSQGLHLCMTLNESMFTKVGFEYQKPDGIVMKTFQPDRISVSCLKYSPQIGILVVGYNFGCFQLWKLSIPVLEYSSRLEFEQLPVTHIAYQEPENDPKNFCYLWVARGHGVTDEDLESVSSVSLYQLAFTHKSFYSNYGVFYDELASICQRLSHELTPTPVQYGSNFEGTSRIVACHTLTDANYQPPVTLGQDESYEEGNHTPDLSLCVFVWEVNTASGSGHHLAVFDINRWYHAHMPASIRYVSGSSDRCSYFSFCRLDEATGKADHENLLAVHVVADRLRKFVSTSVIPPEQHFYPASLAFDVQLVFEAGLVAAGFSGAQRQVLSDLETLGARALAQPQELHGLAVYVGLLPQPTAVEGAGPALANLVLGAQALAQPQELHGLPVKVGLLPQPTAVEGAGPALANLAQQREALLSLALDYNLVSFLKSCIVQWSSGEWEHQGCSLKLLLDWLWEKVSTTKHTIDTTCVNLYNWSGLGLDQRALQTLQQCDRRLKHLIGLLHVFIQTGPTTEQGEVDLQSKLLVTSLLSQHLNIVIWFVGAGLLPESDGSMSPGGVPQFCYPSTGLSLAYKKRRTELQQIHSELQDGDLLMIDGLVEYLGVKELWEREGGSGHYPPPSLHALLSTYLLENIDGLSKHCLVLYLLLDLVSLDTADDKDEMSEKVLKFALRFGVPHTLVRCIQAFWLLDHRDFEEALVLLLDPVVVAEFSRWQHRRVIQALLYQGGARLALRYITSVRPALNTPEEVKLKLTVMLANGMTAEALEYQRVCRDQNNSNDLLTHLFLGCQQTKTVDRLLQLPLTSDEEAVLVNYLTASQEPHSQELLVMHYLQRARFIEAIQLNEKLKHTIMTDASAKARERAAARNAIVDSFAKLLPDVQRKLMFEQSHVAKRAQVQHSVCAKPTPLSTKITQTKASVMSRSAFIFTIIEKLDEIETEDDPRNETMNKSLGPFICTPVTPARKSLRDTPVTAYPEPKEEPGDSVLSKSVFAFQDGGTPKADKRQSRFYSASCLSLLQTPKVQPLKSRTPVKGPSASVITPKSIMKVRNISAKLSPSPHSSNTTPNSQELESSGRKLPRKLGYGGGASQSATPTTVDTPPLSSLPRHLTQEMAAAAASSSQPASPRAASQPTTPKSVSFADSTFSRAATLKTLTTPVKAQTPKRVLTPVRFRVPNEDDEMDKSPLPESSESEQLKKAPPASIEEEEEEHISDDDVEDMDTAGASPDLHLIIPAPGTRDSRQSSTQSTPPHSPQKSPKKPGSGSPTVKISKSNVSAYSSKSNESLSEQQVSSVTEGSPGMSARRAGGLVEKPETVDIDLTEDDEMEVEEDGLEPGPALDPGQAQGLGLSPGELQQQPGSTTHEIFEQDEEMAAGTEQELVEEEVTLGTVSSSDAGVGASQEGEVETQSTRQDVEVETQSAVKQEVEEPSASSQSEEDWHELQRKGLTPISERPIKLITPESSPDSDGGKSDTSPSLGKKDEILRMIEEKFADSPDMPEAASSSQGAQVTKSRTRTRRTFDIKPVKVEIRDSPERKVATAGVDVEAGMGPESGVDTGVSSVSDAVAIAVAGPSSAVSDEDKTAVPKPDSSGFGTAVLSSSGAPEHSASEAEDVKPVEEPLTPSRTRRGRSKQPDDVDVPQPVTPTRSTRRQQRRAEEGSETNDTVRTPTRSTRKKNIIKDEPPHEKLVEISVVSPKKFSQSAREVVQECLIQISESMLQKGDQEASPSHMTKLKNKDTEAKTPPRSSRKSRRSETPTREVPLPSTSSRADSAPGSPRLGSQIGDTEADSSSNNNNNNRNNNRSSPPRLAVDTSEISQLVQAKRTPTRSRRKKESVSEENVVDIGAHSVLPADSGSVMDTATSGRQSFERSEIPEDFEESVETTPSRRRSLPRSCKNEFDDLPVQLPRTPTRRQSLAHSAKLFKEENVGANELAQTRSPLRTPTRRGRPKKIEGSELENIAENETLPLTPSRRGRSKKTENVEDNENMPLTPSRRGRAKKVDKEEQENIESVQEPTTPSRRGRPKKTDISEVDNNKVETDKEPGTPSRRGRSKRTDSETETEPEPLTPSRRGRSKKQIETIAEEKQSESDNVEMPVTPSRRGRKPKTDVAETEAKPATPSRRGRAKKSDAVDMETATSEEEAPEASESRRGRGRKAEPETQVEDEQLKLTPSRSKRRKQEKSESPSPNRAEAAATAGEEAGSKGRATSPRVPNNEVYDIQRASFMFSGPQVLDEMTADPTTPAKPFTPSKSFIFSPPIATHTRSHSQERHTEENKGILLPPGETETSIKDKELKKSAGVTKKVTKKSSRSRKLYKEREEVLLISPVSQGQDDSGSEGRDIITRTTRAGSRRAETRKDGTQLLLKGMKVGLRPQRTSVRFGPIKKKKTDN